MPDYYEVIVSNIGRIHEGDNQSAAFYVYHDYVYRSKHHHGRASGEEVTMFKNSDVFRHYPGELQEGDISQ